MLLKCCELLSIVLTGIVAAMFFAPWAALTRSIHTFSAPVFLAITDRLNRNMAPLMTFLLPAALLSILPVLLLAFHPERASFYLSSAALVFLLGSLLVTMRVEVPIVLEIVTWTPATLPADWQQKRDRWSSFHLLRIACGAMAALLLLIAAVF